MSPFKNVVFLDRFRAKHICVCLMQGRPAEEHLNCCSWRQLADVGLDRFCDRCGAISHDMTPPPDFVADRYSSVCSCCLERLHAVEARHS